MSLTLKTDLGSSQRLFAVIVYVVLLLGLVATAWSSFAALAEQRAALRSAETMLQELNARAGLADRSGGTSFDNARGSPFIEGSSANVAGAMLLQRVGGAVGQVGGSLLSSQVELQGADARDGWISLIVNCELEPNALQQLLYDIEAGMPFLYLDQLVVQAPTAASGEDRMRVLLSVSGQWLGAR